MSRHGSHILSNRIWRNMSLFVVTGVLILCCDNVATEVFLSRPRWPRQEVRCREKSLALGKEFHVMTECFMLQSSLVKTKGLFLS